MKPSCPYASVANSAVDLVCTLAGRLGGPASGQKGRVAAHKWGFPKNRGSLLRVPIIRTVVSWGLYWGPLFRETTKCFYCRQLSFWLATVSDML